MMRLEQKLLRFHALYSKDKETGCWLWIGCITPDGYGHFCGQGARRFSYKHLVGNIPTGRHIDHMCYQKNCVNPAHLDSVLPRTNFIRALFVHRQARLGKDVRVRTVQTGGRCWIAPKF